MKAQGHSKQWQRAGERREANSCPLAGRGMQRLSAAAAEERMKGRGRAHGGAQGGYLRQRRVHGWKVGTRVQRAAGRNTGAQGGEAGGAVCCIERPECIGRQESFIQRWGYQNLGPLLEGPQQRQRLGQGHTWGDEAAAAQRSGCGCLLGSDLGEVLLRKESMAGRAQGAGGLRHRQAHQAAEWLNATERQLSCQLAPAAGRSAEAMSSLERRLKTHPTLTSHSHTTRQTHLELPPSAGIHARPAAMLLAASPLAKQQASQPAEGLLLLRCRAARRRPSCLLLL